MLVLAAAALTFTSCEDVPMPYDKPTPAGGTEVIGDAYLSAAFDKDLSPFSAVTPQGTAWTWDSHKYAKATGYDNATKVTTPSNAYLVSAPIDLGKSQKSFVKFDYILRYYTNNGSPKAGVTNRVVITDKYTGDPTTTEWTTLLDGSNMTEGTDWNTWYTAQVALPAQFVGKKDVVVAFHYTCESNSATWEVRNFSLQEGEPKEEPKPDQPGTLPEGAQGDGTEANPYNAIAANALSLTSKATGVYVKGIVSQVDEISTQYGNATYYISEDGTTKNQFYVFRSYGLNGERFTSEDQLKVGQSVVVRGNFTTYKGVGQLAQGAVIVSIGDTGGGGGTTTSTDLGTVEGNSISLLAADANIATATEIGTLTLKDGTKIAFDKGSNTQAPKFYATDNSFRMYPNNSFTVTSGKKIQSIKLECVSVNGVNATAEGKVTSTVGTVSLADLMLNILDINAANTTVTNVHTGTGAVSQLRFNKITIVYAQ